MQQSLYLKYRPQDFQNLKGQEHIRTTLSNAVTHDRIAHAYLFTGPRGTGKTTTARLIAKIINCPDKTPEGEPCNVCNRCLEANAGQQVDIIEIDAASNRGIDEIRSLRDSANFSPVIAQNKVFIIDEVHMLTKEAFNALLKTLEEPPSFVYFILATTEIHKVPTTIISRCQRFDFNRIAETDLVERLSFICQEESIKVEPQALELIAKLAEGGFRDAISLLDQLRSDETLTAAQVSQKAGLVDAVLLEDFADKLLSGQFQESLQVISAIYQDGMDLSQFTKEIIAYLHNMLLEHAFAQEKERAALCLKCIEHFQQAAREQRTAHIATLPLELAIMKIAGLADHTPQFSTTPASQKQEVTATPAKEPEQTVEKTAEVAPAPEKKPEVVAPQESEAKEQIAEDSAALSIEKIASNWQNIVAKVKDPMSKMPYKDATPVALDNDILTLAFSSNFNKDRASELQAIADIKEAFFATFKKTFDLEFVIK